MARAEEEVREVLARDHEDDVRMLERIAPRSTDGVLRYVRLLRRRNDQYPRPWFECHRYPVYLSTSSRTRTHPTQRVLHLSEDGKSLTQFIFLCQRLRLLCSFAPNYVTS